MIENGFYILKQEYIDLIHRLGGTYADNKKRPVFCCLQDKFVKGLYWAIPTSDWEHRTLEQRERYQRYCSLDDFRSAYYFIGHTNRKAIYKISSCLPITDKYIENVYFSNGRQLVLETENDIKIIQKKLGMILGDEKRRPNHYEQHITDIQNYLISELSSNQQLP
jgi:hypothetical protein